MSAPNHLVAPDGFTLLRKDRAERQGGGVCILCRNDWKMERLELSSNAYECLWAKITCGIGFPIPLILLTGRLLTCSRNIKLVKPSVGPENHSLVR